MSAPISPGDSRSASGEDVRGHDEQRVGSVHLLAERAVRDDGAVGRRVLHERAEHAREIRRRVVSDTDGDPERLCARGDDVDRLRVATRRDEEGLLVVPALELVGEVHRLCGGRGFVEERGVRDREAGQVDHHRLEVEERLEAALRDLCLVRRVLRVPARVLEDVAQDHRGGDAVRVPHAEVRSVDLVLLSDRPRPLEQGGLGHSGTEIERALKADRLGHRVRDERVEGRSAQRLQHAGLILGTRSDVTTNERIRMLEGHRHGARFLASSKPRFHRDSARASRSAMTRGADVRVVYGAFGTLDELAELEARPCCPHGFVVRWRNRPRDSRRWASVRAPSGHALEESAASSGDGAARRGAARAAQLLSWPGVTPSASPPIDLRSAGIRTCLMFFQLLPTSESLSPNSPSSAPMFSLLTV